MIRLAASLTIAALALAPACKRDASDPDETQKVIDDTKEDVAETRIDIDEKQEEVVAEQGDVSDERSGFIARTEAELDDIDHRIQELRGQVEQRAKGMSGEAQRDLRLAMTDLESMRDASRAALERFRKSTTARSVEIKQATEQALATLRNAYDQMTGRLGADDDTATDKDALRITPISPPAGPTP